MRGVKVIYLFMCMSVDIRKCGTYMWYTDHSQNIPSCLEKRNAITSVLRVLIAAIYSNQCDNREQKMKGKCIKKSRVDCRR